MVSLKEVNKQEDSYYQGGFWIIGDSISDILKGNFKIDGKKFLTDYNGKYINLNQSVKSLTHKRLWRDEFSNKYGTDLDYTYYPRGRVSIYNGTAYIHIHHLFNTPKIIDAIIKYYNIEKLNIEIELNDETQGSHYEFLLK
jgi:hypothetical protein